MCPAARASGTPRPRSRYTNKQVRPWSQFSLWLLDRAASAALGTALPRLPAVRALRLDVTARDEDLAALLAGVAQCQDLEVLQLSIASLRFLINAC